MLTLIDGPVAGAYMCRRAPIYLRAVIDRNAKGRDNRPKRDVLNEVSDTPEPDEEIHVYRIEGEPSSLFACGRGGLGGLYVRATYRHIADAHGESLRATKDWRDWVMARYSAETDTQSRQSR